MQKFTSDQIEFIYNAIDGCCRLLTVQLEKLPDKWKLEKIKELLKRIIAEEKMIETKDETKKCHICGSNDMRVVEMKHETSKTIYITCLDCGYSSQTTEDKKSDKLEGK